MLTCLHVYMLTRLPNCMFTYSHAYILICLNVGMIHAYMLACLHAYMLTCLHAYLLASLRTRMVTCLYAWTLAWYMLTANEHSSYAGNFRLQITAIKHSSDPRTQWPHLITARLTRYRHLFLAGHWQRKRLLCMHSWRWHQSGRSPNLSSLQIQGHSSIATYITGRHHSFLLDKLLQHGC